MEYHEICVFPVDEQPLSPPAYMGAAAHFAIHVPVIAFALLQQLQSIYPCNSMGFCSTAHIALTPQ